MFTYFNIHKVLFFSFCLVGQHLNHSNCLGEKLPLEGIWDLSLCRPFTCTKNTLQKRENSKKHNRAPLTSDLNMYKFLWQNKVTIGRMSLRCLLIWPNAVRSEIEAENPEAPSCPKQYVWGAKMLRCLHTFGTRCALQSQLCFPQSGLTHCQSHSALQLHLMPHLQESLL